MSIRLRVISLGAGVQSTTMALMAAHGEIGPMPDCAIFADTGWEPRAVYEHLSWLMSGNVLPFPVQIVSAGNIKDDLIAGGSGQAGRFVTIPAYWTSSKGTAGIGVRQCTSHYKVEPLRREVRRMLGAGPRDRIAPGSVEKWLGISLDEIIRATPAKVKFETNRFPLLEKRMSRRDCVAWLERNSYPTPPKSACIGCPFHTDAAWRQIRDQTPSEWAEAIEVDRKIRRPTTHKGGGWRGEQFLHPQRVPLAQVDLSTAEDHGQLNLFMDECEGMCGV